MSYLFHLIIYFEIFAVLALSLNLAVGYCGLFTLAHASFYAVGAYAYAILSVRLGADFGVALVLGAGIAAFLSLLLSLPARRLRGDFFMAASLAVQVLIYALIYNWHTQGEPLGSVANLTNGPYGIVGVAGPTLAGYRFETIGSLAVLYGGLFLLIVLTCWRLVHSPWGRLLELVRDDELAARGIGKDTNAVKTAALAISCAMASVAGAMYAGYVGFVDPSVASLGESVLVLCMILVGGLGNFAGPLAGAVLLLGLPEGLRQLGFPDVLAANLRLLAYGLLLLLVVHFRPRGILGQRPVE